MTNLIDSGKTKQLFQTNQEDILRVHYTNHTTAGDGLRNELINNKGAVNNQISSLLFKYLNNLGVPNHFIQQVSKTDQLNKKVKMIPLEVIVRNLASGHFQKRFGTESLAKLALPVVEFFMKSDELHDPMVNDSSAQALNIASADEINTMRKLALKVNEALSKLFKEVDVILVDFKVEFGIDSNNNVILADEISPDSCRLIDMRTNTSLDKDIFRHQSGNMMKGYYKVLHKLQEKLD
ncbi:phosphoribosylaminoimidazolesuccinocarboxamide synthase [Apilactobacillus quenuiae]|uniref:phosphoribosylaminoimidazolesuccinocarboxamide synthase n=1 Tax=Apilactobacillus quenuiae TaxID=2008377 RepID=UPI000D01DCC0|nr:phosphoribosylaminoimidazolesuccinocarboxamide synthase [Apilactobacillus quenuiae]